MEFTLESGGRDWSKIGYFAGIGFPTDFFFMQAAGASNNYTGLPIMPATLLWSISKVDS